MIFFCEKKTCSDKKFSNINQSYVVIHLKNETLQKNCRKVFCVSLWVAAQLCSRLPRRANQFSPYTSSQQFSVEQNIHPVNQKAATISYPQLTIKNCCPLLKCYCKQLSLKAQYGTDVINNPQHKSLHYSQNKSCHYNPHDNTRLCRAMQVVHASPNQFQTTILISLSAEGNIQLPGVKTSNPGGAQRDKEREKACLFQTKAWEQNQITNNTGNYREVSYTDQHSFGTESKKSNISIKKQHQ